MTPEDFKIIEWAADVFGCNGYEILAEEIRSAKESLEAKQCDQG